MALFIMQILHSEIEADVSYNLVSVKPLWRISENRGSFYKMVISVAQGACNSQLSAP